MIGGFQKRYLLDNFWLEPDKHVLTRAGQPVHLPKKPFQVLVQLIEHRDRYVGRNELLDLFWEGRDVYDDALRKCVGSIRKALDDQTDTPRFIETRWGVGYRYIGPLEVQFVQGSTTLTDIEKTRAIRIVVEEEEISDETAETGMPEVKGSALASLSLSSALGQYPKLMTFALMFLVVMIGAAVVIGSRQGSRGRTGAVANPPAEIRSIAVLPLRNLSSDSESEYFSDGITENLINTLSRIEGLNVISRGSAFTFKGKEADPREVKDKLGAGAMIEGSVLKSDGRVRVNVRLVSTEDGRVLWASNTYDRSVGDIFTVQDEIARNVAAGLRLELSGQDEQRLTRRYTDNVEAYEELMRGWYFWTQRTPGGLRKAIASYQRATELDPHCAVAYAGLAGSYAMGIWYIPLEPKEAMRKAKLAANKAMEIDSRFPEVHLAMSHVLGYEWDWSGSAKEMERARELDPNYSGYGYAYTLLAAGKPDEAVLWIKRSEKLDPLSPLVSANVGQILYYARRYDEAIEQCQKALELDPNYAMAHTHLGQAYIQKRMYREAEAELQKALVLSEQNPEIKAILGYAYAAAGDHQAAQKLIGELTQPSNNRYAPPYCVAEIYAVLGRKDDAFAWLEKAYRQRAPHILSLPVEPTLDSLRSDPRFANLLRRTNLT